MPRPSFFSSWQLTLVNIQSLNKYILAHLANSSFWGAKERISCRTSGPCLYLFCTICDVDIVNTYSFHHHPSRYVHHPWLRQLSLARSPLMRLPIAIWYKASTWKHFSVVYISGLASVLPEVIFIVPSCSSASSHPDETLYL